ncbi:MAG: hypothetical protein Q8R28_13480 [Dehalococcoidia bacterium]|nr:hypothetical protein [Dehalococcoidia bacterium]
MQQPNLHVWEQNPETGDQEVSIPDVSGPFWWAQLHAWAENIRDVGCPTCGEFAVKAATALHDVVNNHLGKPIQHPANLREIAAAFEQAADATVLMVVGTSQDYTIEGERYLPAPLEAARGEQGPDPDMSGLMDTVIAGGASAMGAALGGMAVQRLLGTGAPATQDPETVTVVDDEDDVQAQGSVPGDQVTADLGTLLDDLDNLLKDDSQLGEVDARTLRVTKG